MTLGEWNKSTQEDWAANRALVASEGFHIKDNVTSSTAGSERVTAYLAGGISTCARACGRMLNTLGVGPTNRSLAKCHFKVIDPYEELLHGGVIRSVMRMHGEVVELAGVGPIGIVRFNKKPDDAHAVISVNVSHHSAQRPEHVIRTRRMSLFPNRA